MQSTLRIPGLMVFCLLVAAPASAQLIISEFRLRGPGGANDEYVEIMNNSASPHTVAATSGTGYALAASDGSTRCSIPNGTVIPARGHYLCANSIAYSLAAYAAGNGTTATADATYTTGIGDGVGIALFNTNLPGSFSLATRFDAVGSTSEANALYKEGAGYPTIPAININYALARDQCGKQGSTSAAGSCPNGGAVVDTNDNATDFVLVDPNGTPVNGVQRLGAPGPQNLSSPLVGTASMPAAVLDPCVGAGALPNFVRDVTSDGPNNSLFGTLDFRATLTNNTGQSITRLRFRVVDLSTFPTPVGTADLRVRSSSDAVITVDRPPCGAGTSNVTVRGTTLEQLPNQPNGGGFNSSLSSAAVTLATPLANGSTINVHFLLGVQQTGDFRFSVLLETLPIGAGTLIEYSGCTDSCGVTMSTRPPLSASRDFNLDGKADILWRNNISGAASIWLMDGISVIGSGSPGGAPTNFSIAGVGDFNRDGKADILWRNTTSGEVFIWLINGTTVLATGSLGVVTTDWVIVGVGDFDGDGRADILWRNTISGAVFIWFINGTTVTGSVSLGSVTADYTIAGLGDFNGDHKADILWRHSPSGAVFVWLLNGTGVASSSSPGGAGSDFAIVGVGDFNADGRTDVLWRNTTTGQVFIWLMNDTGVIGTGSPGSAGTDWIIARVSDFNGDGKDDLVWRHTPSGTVHIWLLNGTGFAGSGALGVVGTDWVIQ